MDYGFVFPRKWENNEKHEQYNIFFVLSKLFKLWINYIFTKGYTPDLVMCAFNES